MADWNRDHSREGHRQALIQVLYYEEMEHPPGSGLASARVQAAIEHWEHLEAQVKVQRELREDAETRLDALRNLVWFLYGDPATAALIKEMAPAVAEKIEAARNP